MLELEANLLDIIFLSKKQEFGVILYPDNTMIISDDNFDLSYDVLTEFESIKKEIQYIGYICEVNIKKLYEYMIKTYEVEHNLPFIYRKNLILGMIFSDSADQYDHRDSITNDEDFGCLMNDRWNQFLLYAKEQELDPNLIHDATFMGIYMQEQFHYQQQLNKPRR